MWKEIKKHARVLVPIILCIIMIAIGIEIGIFNFKYFTLEQNEKGIINLEESDLQLTDIEIEDGILTITGANPQIKISDKYYISDIMITAQNSSNDYAITINKTNGKSRSYEVNRKISILKVDSSNGITINIDDKKMNDLKFENIAIDNTFEFNFMRFGIIVSISICGLFLIKYKQIAEKKIHITFLVISLCMGISMALLTPTYFTFDEREHFVKAYEVSELDLGFSNKYDQNWIQKIYMFLQSDGVHSKYNSYKEKKMYMNEFFSNDYNRVQQFKTTASTYLFFAYIPSAVGIAIGRVIGLPFILTFYLGRILSVIVYSLLGTLIIKNINIGKRLVFAICLLPSILFLAGAYSADSMTLMFSMFAMMIFINMLSSKEGEVGYKQITLFALGISMLIMSKMTYAPLCILIGCIPKAKFNKNVKPLISKLAVIVAAGVVSILTFLYSNGKDLQQWPIEGVNSGKQVMFIFTNLFTYIKIMLHSVSQNIMGYLSGISVILAYVPPLPSVFLFIVAVGLIFIAVCDEENEVVEVNNKQKLYIATSVVLSWSLVLTALYITFNPVGSKQILGVQGRYIFPLVFPFMLLFKNKRKYGEFKKEKVNYLLSIVLFFMLVMTVVKIFTLYNR